MEIDKMKINERN